jgi:hypothetical protein
MSSNFVRSKNEFFLIYYQVFQLFLLKNLNSVCKLVKTEFKKKKFKICSYFDIGNFIISYTRSKQESLEFVSFLDWF